VAKAAFAAKVCTSGQTCVRPTRFPMQNPIYAAIIEAPSDLTKTNPICSGVNDAIAEAERLPFAFSDHGQPCELRIAARAVACIGHVSRA
jgi:acyl-CoA reductase-like NAD-dependent aldehyde dehydrogenase